MRARRPLPYALLLALYLLHTDLWLWNDPGWSFGLPVGLTYHVFYCFAAAAAMALLVRHAWPRELAADDLADERAADSDAAASGKGAPR